MITSAVVALLVGLGVAAGFNFIARLDRGMRLLGLFASSAAVLSAPVIVPGAAGLTRLVVAGYSVILCMKMWDVHIAASRGRRVALADHVRFLLNVGSLVQRRGGDDSRTPRADVARTVRGGSVAAVGIAGFFWLIAQDWTHAPLFAEHSLKATAFLLMITGSFEAVTGVIRLFGGKTPRPTTFPLLAVSPAHFWRGLNLVVGEFLREDVFRVVGGRFHPRIAALITFVISGVIHEYAFTMAVGRMQGFQLSFFIIHGSAVAVTLRHFPRGWAGRCITLAFNLVTSVLFFASFEGIAPGVFFQHGVPAFIPQG